MSQGGWGEGKKKARWGRWEGEREEARLAPFPSSHCPPRAYCCLYMDTQREPLGKRMLIEMKIQQQDNKSEEGTQREYKDQRGKRAWRMAK